jgi:hypothetical protein
MKNYFNNNKSTELIIINNKRFTELNFEDKLINNNLYYLLIL